jgi:hypothetical protein
MRQRANAPMRQQANALMHEEIAMYRAIFNNLSKKNILSIKDQSQTLYV